ncbi:carboxymuconolactone decarboxylase family protein [Aquimarina sp. AU474]|uniref:carboxymuconolactone decarboxylase family protein n=1 Tax=Aquimarina sp. AU474 TaxID=2108529 RepID=UPI000D694462|nr:carboxymuconolactone decarboxylase family protein [Aquimarina sp. AU474]
MTTTTNFTVPTKGEVSENNQTIFDNLQNALGFVPNIYAAMAHSNDALKNYLEFSNAKTSFSKKEKEVIDLAVSQVNDCRYCQSAHTAISKMNGFNDDQIIELRSGKASWDHKYDTLASISKSIAISRGKISEEETAKFYEVGYTKENLVDLVMAIGIITITNLFHNITQVDIDFPVAPKL